MCLGNVPRSLFRIATHGVLTLTESGSIVAVGMRIRGGLFVRFREEWRPCPLASLPSMLQSCDLVASHLFVGRGDKSGRC